jgi:molecular chaperone GrpE (heat shock protein)
MVEELSREIRKLEVRLDRFVTEEEGFVKKLQNCLVKFRVLNQNLERVKTKPDPKMVEELSTLRLESIEALSEALEKGSDAEHERSHLLESYGALILALERAFKDLNTTK